MIQVYTTILQTFNNRYCSISPEITFFKGPKNAWRPTSTENVSRKDSLWVAVNNEIYSQII